jgi:hypothetical protein
MLRGEERIFQCVECVLFGFIELRKGQSEGPKCKIVPPRGASHNPGMDITMIDVDELLL